MKLFCLSSLDVKPYVLAATKLDGIALWIPASGLFSMGCSFGGVIGQVKGLIRNTDKEFTVGIVFGSEVGNCFYNNFPFETFLRHHHNDPESPDDPIKVPVFWNERYLNYIDDMIFFFANELKKEPEIYKKIIGINITGDNETSLEMKNTVTDYSLTANKEQAQKDAAAKWIKLGYTPQKCYDANTRLIRIFHQNFPDKKLIFKKIRGVGGVACVGVNGQYVAPKKRPHTTDMIIDYGNNLTPNFYSADTAYNLESDVDDLIVQLRENQYGKNIVNLAEFDAVLTKARSNGIEILEVSEDNVRNYPTIFN